jgi:hypothetical protein
MTPINKNWLSQFRNRSGTKKVALSWGSQPTN